MDQHPRPSKVGTNPPTPPQPWIVIICGPTGIGKTSVAVEIASAVGGEIISADSMQVYRYMDIGTAKPTSAETARVPHHLIDVADPDEPFDAARFLDLARPAIHRLVRAGKPVFVVGGTGLYIKALTEGLFPAPASSPEVRERLRRMAEAEGAEAVHRRLADRDPETAARLHVNDTFRVLRALEVFETTGRPISALHRDHDFSDRPYRTLKIALFTDREVLYDRIDRRVDEMIGAGLLEEVSGLLAKGYGAGLKSMGSLGYRQMVAYLSGELTWDEAVRTMKRDTRRYAKRQLTWFRADPEMVWLRPDEIGEIRGRVEAFLGHDHRLGRCVPANPSPRPPPLKERG
jgi:tRNA dimethylallyltransferase